MGAARDFVRGGHVDGTRAGCVLADRLLERGFLAVFTAVLISVLAVFAVGHRLSGNAVSEWNILSPEGREHKRCSIVIRQSGCYHPCVAIIVVGGYLCRSE